MKRTRAAQAQFAIAVLATLLFARTAYAQAWYLMAADAKAIGEPKVASLMAKGSMAGPVHFISQGQFEGRRQCEQSERAEKA